MWGTFQELLWTSLPPGERNPNLCTLWGSHGPSNRLGRAAGKDVPGGREGSVEPAHGEGRLSWASASRGPAAQAAAPAAHGGPGGLRPHRHVREGKGGPAETDGRRRSSSVRKPGSLRRRHEPREEDTPGRTNRGGLVTVGGVRSRARAGAAWRGDTAGAAPAGTGACSAPTVWTSDASAQHRVPRDSADGTLTSPSVNEGRALCPGPRVRVLSSCTETPAPA